MALVADLPMEVEAEVWSDADDACLSNDYDLDSLKGKGKPHKHPGELVDAGSYSFANFRGIRRLRFFHTIFAR